jgi:BON domain
MPDDITLQAMVMDELAWTPNVDAAHIGVAARNGVITLSGIVGSVAEKVAAEQAARRVKGVQGIAQAIVVRPSTAHRHADEEIADRALKVLNWDLEVPDERIQSEGRERCCHIDRQRHLSISKASRGARSASWVASPTSSI